MVDFSRIDIRVGSGGLSRKQPLVKAFGQRVRTIIDATAGLGHDTFLLACCGFEVTALERNPVVYALLRDGLRRAELDPRLRAAMNGRLRVVHADALQALREGLEPWRLEDLKAPGREISDQPAASESARSIIASKSSGLQASRPSPQPDAIFIDPMFPPKRKKSALAKKSIRLVRQLVGDDADASELLASALQVARDRVVVKRADDAAPLRDKPSLSFGGKLARYDVYLVGR
jgi:16S rRNA (guanine1516-N2)-methyltransferase